MFSQQSLRERFAGHYVFEIKDICYRKLETDRLTKFKDGKK
jgi:hypothetical protein